jgi:choline kinase|tara:strand:- start:2026 stop:2730 length:705 start_codon:yes stop_codon:yes gene_type:complete
MKGLVLAAGTGSRLKKIVNDVPKGLIKINDVPIIKRQIDYFEKNHFDEITIITGYKHQMIEKELKEKEIKYLYNPFYKISNNIVSVWMANPVMNDNYICTYADLLYEEKILKAILKTEADICIAIDRSKIEAGNCLVQINGNKVTALKKEILEDDADARFIGIAKFSNNIRNIFQYALDDALKKGHLKDYYTRAIESLNKKNELTVKYVDVTGLRWMEIDEEKDYYKALNFFDE